MGASLKSSEFAARDSRGFTLVELVMVTLLFGLISLMVVNRFDSIFSWRQQQGFRSFLNTWEFVFREALARRTAYRLIINLDDQSYSVVREVDEIATASRQVDYLKNLRTRSERDRRAQSESEELLSIDEEFKREDDRQAESLEKLFFQFAYRDPHSNVRLARPLEFPQLAEPVKLPNGVRFQNVKLYSELIDRGNAAIRFSPRGAADFAVVHIDSGGQPFSAIMNPSTGELVVKSGYIDYEWKLSESRP